MIYKYKIKEKISTDLINVKEEDHKKSTKMNSDKKEEILFN